MTFQNEESSKRQKTIKKRTFSNKKIKNTFACRFSFNKKRKSWDYKPVMNGVEKQVDKPGERVLVHWINIWQISYGEEQHRGMRSYWIITSTRLINFGFRFFGNLTKTEKKVNQ